MRAFYGKQVFATASHLKSYIRYFRCKSWCVNNYCFVLYYGDCL